VQVSSSGLLSQYAYDYVDKHRSELKKFKSFNEFNAAFAIDQPGYRQFIDYCSKNGVAKDEKGAAVSAKLICNQIKALVARQLWKNDGFYPVIHQLDNTVQKALMLMQTNQVAER
jgi:carboxyl-terminal processing protease